MKELCFYNLDNRTYITFAEYISTDNYIISAFIIILEKIIL